MRYLTVFAALILTLFCIKLAPCAAENTPACPIPFCLRCPLVDDKLVCEECRRTHALDKESNSCITCTINSGCALCKNTTFCERCTSLIGWSPDRNGVGTCSPCAENCVTCLKRGPGKCDRCANGYFLNSEGTCSGCHINCLRCNSLQYCRTCISGFYRENENTCTGCNVDHCDLCASTSTCRICLSGYYLESPTSCTVSPCASKNCKKCEVTDGKHKCKICANGKPSLTGFCECDRNCIDCSVSRQFGQDFSVCVGCKDGYTLTDDKQCVKHVD
jgi:hypothetical protein